MSNHEHRISDVLITFIGCTLRSSTVKTGEQKPSRAPSPKTMLAFAPCTRAIVLSIEPEYELLAAMAERAIFLYLRLDENTNGDPMEDMEEEEEML